MRNAAGPDNAGRPPRGPTPLARLLRRLREHAGLTQEQLAAASSLSVGTIRGLEAGRIARPRNHSVRVLAEGLGLSAADRDVLFRVARGEAESSGSAHGLRPYQLPADVRGFAGRQEHLGQLDEILLRSGQESGAIAVISGMAGIGKTTLAIHWAHRMRTEFPSGQLYVNLGGYGPSGSLLEPRDALRGFLEALSVPPERMPQTLPALSGLYRSLLEERRMLIVLDNARNAAQIRPLLSGSAGCLTLVTSRNRLTGLVVAEGAQPIRLDPLRSDEARTLLVNRLTRRQVAAEQTAVDDIIALCAGLPLALAIAAAYAATQPGFSLATVAGQLRDATNRLEAFQDEDETIDVRRAFFYSYRQLDATAARLFCLLALHPGPIIAAPAAANLVAEPLDRTRRLLADLTHAHLLREPSPGRYALHDLLREYATELVQRDQSRNERREANCRLLAYYTHSAYVAASVLYPQRDPILLPLDPPPPGIVSEHFTDARAAASWLIGEHRAILAVLRAAVRAGFHTQAWQLAWAMDSHLYQRGHWSEGIAVWRSGLTAATRLGSMPAQAYARRMLARAHGALGEDADCLANLESALADYTVLDDANGQGHTLLDLVVYWQGQGQTDTSLGHAARAFELYQTTRHRRGQANALNSIAWLEIELGHLESAISHGRDALRLQEEDHEKQGEAEVLDTLALAYHHLGLHQQAADCYRRALQIFQSFGNRRHEAAVLTRLADSYHATGDISAARATWEAALAVYDELDLPGADNVRIRLRQFNPAC